MSVELEWPRGLSLLGVPSSAGARRTGHERAPRALRRAGFVHRLREFGIDVLDHGDLAEIISRPDPEHPQQQNCALVAHMAREVAASVERVAANGRFLVVLGGDCTISLGVVSGLLANVDRLGLVYFDGDLDLNTPETTPSGIFDGMVTAHLLGRGARELAELGPRFPLVDERHLLYFGYNVGAGGIDPAELAALERSATLRVPVEAILEEPAATARIALAELEARVDRTLVHFDVDVTDTPAVDVSHVGGLPLERAAEALAVFIASPSCVGLVVTEHNPELDPDDATARRLARHLAEALHAARPRLGRP